MVSARLQADELRVYRKQPWTDSASAKTAQAGSAMGQSIGLGSKMGFTRLANRLAAFSQTAAGKITAEGASDWLDARRVRPPTPSSKEAIVAKHLTQ